MCNQKGQNLKHFISNFLKANFYDLHNVFMANKKNSQKNRLKKRHLSLFAI